MKSLFLLCIVHVFGRTLRKNNDEQTVSRDLSPEASSSPSTEVDHYSKTQNGLISGLADSGHMGQNDDTFEMTKNMICKKTTGGMKFFMRIETFLPT